MRALITGATGFIGRRLAGRTREPVVLTRNPERARGVLPGAEVHGWDGHAADPPAEALRGVEVVFHLAGEPVAAGRWTAERKELIRASRVEGTARLVSAIAASPERPRVLVSASAVGYYGSRGDEWLDEQSSPGGDFLAQVCMDWEAAAARAREFGVRVVQARIGVVLGRDGGAIPKMLTPFKLGLGGRLGSGKQWMPWIHLDDAVGLLLHAAATASLEGPLNTVAPSPVTNREFTRALARVLRRPAVFPVPGFALKLLVGEFGEVLLTSQRVACEKARQSGYSFQYPQLEPALRSVLDRMESAGGRPEG